MTSHMDCGVSLESSLFSWQAVAKPSLAFIIDWKVVWTKTIFNFLCVILFEVTSRPFERCCRPNDLWLICCYFSELDGNTLLHTDSTKLCKKVISVTEVCIYFYLKCNRLMKCFVEKEPVSEGVPKSDHASTLRTFLPGSYISNVLINQFKNGPLSRRLRPW